MDGQRSWEKTDGFLDDFVVEKWVQVEDMDGHGDHWRMGGEDEIELDNVSVDGRVGDWNGFGNWFHLLGNIGLDWDEFDGRLGLVRFRSDGLGDNNWLFFLDGLLLFFGRLDGFGDDDRFGLGNLANGFGNLDFDYLRFSSNWFGNFFG